MTIRLTGPQGLKEFKNPLRILLPPFPFSSQEYWGYRYALTESISTWVLGIQTSVPMLAQEALYWMSHLLSPNQESLILLVWIYLCCIFSRKNMFFSKFIIKHVLIFLPNCFGFQATFVFMLFCYLFVIITLLCYVPPGFLSLCQYSICR